MDRDYGIVKGELAQGDYGPHPPLFFSLILVNLFIFYFPLFPPFLGFVVVCEHSASRYIEE